MNWLLRHYIIATNKVLKLQDISSGESVSIKSATIFADTFFFISGVHFKPICGICTFLFSNKNQELLSSEKNSHCILDQSAKCVA